MTTFSGLADPFLTLLIVPSGIGCSIGGYAGDAIPSARLLAAASGSLITHPNVMNGATLYWSDPRIQYVEGFALDRFSCGEVALRPVREQCIGLLFDVGIDSELLQRHIQTANACAATLGLNIGPVVKTEEALDIHLQNGFSGASWGSLNKPDVLLRAGERLKEAGATAIAVVTRFPDGDDIEDLNKYRRGEAVDALAGAEAVISHLLVRYLSIPCAHAPALKPLPLDPGLDPRAAGEELGYTFLPSVLVGLSRAPDLLNVSNLDASGRQISDLLTVDQLGAVVAPDGALGGESVLACFERGVPLIAVSNPGVLNLTLTSLGLIDQLTSKEGLRLFYARNYVEAAGLLTLMREGIAPESVLRPFHGIATMVD